jgi:hypothetical protein
MKHFIKLDKNRELRFNLGSFYFIQEESGVEMEDLYTLLQDRKKFIKLLPTLIHAGLLKHNKDLSYEEKKDLIDDIDMDPEAVMEILVIISKAITHSKDQDSKNELSPKARIPSGKKRNKNGAGGDVSVQGPKLV